MKAYRDNTRTGSDTSMNAALYRVGDGDLRLPRPSDALTCALAFAISFKDVRQGPSVSRCAIGEARPRS